MKETHEQSVKKGKKNRASGKAFEKKVRADLEIDCWIVFRNSNNVIDGKYQQAKAKWNPFTKRPMMTQGGFPDFICIHRDVVFPDSVRFVECKSNGYLDFQEREKCNWIIDNLKLPIFIASKGEKRGTIEYHEYKKEAQ